ncbi:copper chaperone PCu(A)C [Chloroflexales bacterium ZM16-3]|nr:copper chaperone PCu(A)C [Chloroflexales bacterium ZM16-3]
MQILGIMLGIMLLAACGPSPAKLSINEPWARAAAMTGASASGGNMGNSGTMSGTTGMGNSGAMSGTMDMGGTDTAPSGGTSAAYMVIANTGGTADALIKAESDVADSVELHTMTMQDNVMKMTPVEKIDIPANGQAELKPGSFHVMLIGLRHDLNDGDIVKLTLTFQNSGTMQVEAPVRKP